MFNSKMKQYNIYSFSIVLNDYKEEIKTPVFYKQVPMFISLSNHNPYLSNNLKLQEVTHIAITNDKTLEVGMRIEDTLYIQFINDAAKDVVVYLKEVV